MDDKQSGFQKKSELGFDWINFRARIAGGFAGLVLAFPVVSFVLRFLTDGAAKPSSLLSNVVGLFVGVVFANFGSMAAVAYLNRSRETSKVERPGDD